MPARVSLTLTTLVLACGGTDSVDSGNFLAGTYAATVFVVTPVGQSPINVLAAGGSLSISIDASGNTTGTLTIPASINGGSPLTASMAGTATITALTVQFDQSADTFVRDLTWSRVGATLTVVNQAAGSASHTITLTRQ